jgi:hypothetical protein
LKISSIKLGNNNSSKMEHYRRKEEKVSQEQGKKKGKAVPLHAMKALGGRSIAPTHSRPRH